MAALRSGVCCSGAALELRQLAPVPLQKLFVNVAVRVIPNLADPISPKPEDAAGSLVHHVFRVGLQPRALADLHDHPLLRLVPIAPDVLVSPVGGAQAGLAVPERIEHRLAASPFAADPWSARHPVHDVISGVAPCFRSVPCEQRLLVRLGHIQTTAHTVISSISSGSGRVLALRPARSIGLSISALCRSMMVQKSSARSSNSYAASLSVSLIFTCRTLFCMSSASQPRECAMNGNGGNTKPSSAQNVNMAPATAWMLSWPPVMMNAATLFLISTLSWIVTWFCTQFKRSIIL